MSWKRVITHDDPRIRNPTFNFGVVFHEEFTDDFIKSDDDFPVSEMNEVMPSTINISDDSLDDLDLSTVCDVSHLISTETGTSKRKLPDEANHDIPIKQRFEKISNSEEIDRRIRDNVPQKTRYQNQWCVRVWQSWAEWRNECKDESLVTEKFKTVPTVIDTSNPEELGFWLARFILEVKRKDGKVYPPATLFQICCGIQRHYNEINPFNKIKVFQKDDPNFYKFYGSADNIMRELTDEGIGLDVDKADPFTPADENTLWETGVISSNNPQSLLNAIYFYNVKCFSLRGGQIHRNLKKKTIHH